MSARLICYSSCIEIACRPNCKHEPWHFSGHDLSLSFCYWWLHHAHGKLKQERRNINSHRLYVITSYPYLLGCEFYDTSPFFLNQHWIITFYQQTTVISAHRGTYMYIASGWPKYHKELEKMCEINMKCNWIIHLSNQITHYIFIFSLMLEMYASSYSLSDERASKYICR